MKNFYLVFILFFVACNSSQKKIEEPPVKIEEITDTSKCLFNWEIHSRAYPGEYELDHFGAQMFIPSCDFKNNKRLWYFEMKDLKIDTLTRLLAIDTIDMKLCINSEYFSDFVPVNLTRMTDEHVLGILKPALLKKMSLQKILLFLMRAEIIQTYVHLNAEICLKEETESDEAYRAEFSAVYHYCTNDCYDELYKFGVTVNKKTGVIFVRPVLNL